MNPFAPKKLYRSRGDLARDQKDWSRAEASYRRHLETAPDDVAIRVQLGHALKEQGRLEDAEEAYREAVRRTPGDLDTLNHLAHLLKRLGETAEAAEQFTRLFQLSGRRDAYDELQQIITADTGEQVPAPMDRTVQGDAVFIEVNDLLGFLEAHKTVTGIQRVQLSVIKHLLADPPAGTRYLFVLNEPASPCLWQVGDKDMAGIIAYLQQPEVIHARLRALVAKARARATAVLAGRGHAYFVLGTFWAFGAVAARYTALKRAGVALGIFVYDLIPITHNEYCDEGLPHEFKLSFGDSLAVVDFMLAISEFSASQVRTFVKRLGLPEKPIVVVPLAHANHEPARPADAARTPRARRCTTSPLDELQGRPFAMMVSTIEARKNHGYLVAAWKAFLDEGLDPPDLVFVGRQGWRVSSLMELLETSRYLDGRVHILHDLSDADLTTLYDACEFTLFPSFVEGWGLPVGESLARGKPCIASSTSSMPEVGGEFVDYVDPLNLRDGLEVIRRMAFDKAYRDRRAADIRARFRPRTWADVSLDLIAKMDRLRRGATVNTRPEVLFPSGSVFTPGELALGNRLPDTYARHPLRSILVRGWYGMEPAGSWMQGHRGEVAFRSDLPAGTRIVVYLGLYTAASASRRLKLDVVVGADGTAPDGVSDYNLRDKVGRSFSLMVTGTVGEQGLVHIGFSLTGPVGPETPAADSHRFALGLGFVCYAPADDSAARMQVLERLVMDRSDDRRVAIPRHDARQPERIKEACEKPGGRTIRGP